MFRRAPAYQRALDAHRTTHIHRAPDSWGIPRQIEPDFRIFCTTICDFDETWSEVI